MLARLVATAPVTDRPPGARSSRLGYLPALDGLRAIAVSVVFLFHANVISGGFLGVDVFFVISGFLITALALDEIERTGRLRLGAFWGRRARRLLPALFALLGVVVLVAAVAGARAANLRRDIISTLLYVANWTRVSDDYDYFAAYEEPSVLEHTWSLAVEEQFYLVWPVVIVGVAVVARRLRWGVVGSIGITAGVLAIASTGWSWWLAATDRAPFNRLYFGSDTRAVGLAVGCVAACVLSSRRSLDRRTIGTWATVAALAGAVVLCVLSLTLDGRETWLYGPGFAIIALASVGLVNAAAGDGTVARILAVGPLPAIGRVSYGVYLWHWPVIVVLDSERTGLSGLPLGVLWVAATAVTTAASWWLVERPAPLPLARRPGRAAGYVAVAAVIGLATFVVVPTYRPTFDLAATSAADLIVDAPAPTLTTITITTPTNPTATTTPTTPTAPTTASATSTPATVAAATVTTSADRNGDGVFTVLVLGDSVAESLGPAPPVPIEIEGLPVAAVNHGIVACPVAWEGRWQYDSGSVQDDPAGCDGDDRFDEVVSASAPDLIVTLFGWSGTIAGRLLDDGTVSVACEPEHDRAYVDAHVDLARRYADVAPVAVATPAPPQTYRDESQSDRPGCMADALLESELLDVVDYGGWLCPDGDCAPAAALRRDPIHFAADDAVRDIAWRELLAGAYLATMPPSAGSSP
jgi:peptidoglycan/LPS O-acetylase OafA/YrhL